MSIDKDGVTFLHSSGVLCKQTCSVQKINAMPKTLHAPLQGDLVLTQLSDFLRCLIFFFSSGAVWNRTIGVNLGKISVFFLLRKML